MHTWASINKSNSDNRRLYREFQPFYGRDSVQDSNKLEKVVWSQERTGALTVSLTLALPLHKLRATFVIGDVKIEKLKDLATIKNLIVGRLSTFVMVCAHLWSCLAMSAAAAEEEVDDAEPEYLGSLIDCRARLDPPLPSNYFGNCLMLLLAISTHGRLKGKDGFVATIEAIVVAIRKTIREGRGASDFFKNRSRIHSEFMGKRLVSVAGSSRLDQYCGADYGWGAAVKYECIHTDFNGSVHFGKARDKGVEIGLSLPKAKMHSFASIFNKYLCYSILHNNL